MGEGSKLNNRHSELPAKSNDVTIALLKREHPALRNYRRLIRDLKEEKQHI